MAKRNIRRWVILTKTLLLTLAPIYVPVLLLVHFGFRIESILGSILFVQIYVLVVQAEAMLRQAEWTRAAYDVDFEISAAFSGSSCSVSIENVGERPAYNFFVGFRDETEGKPLEQVRIDVSEIPRGETHALIPKGKQTFYLRITEEEFRKQRILLSVSYNNALGQPRDIRAISFEGSDKFLMLPSQVKLGFLIPAYEDLQLYFRWLFYYRKVVKG